MKSILDEIKSEADAVQERVKQLSQQIKDLSDGFDDSSDDLTPMLNLQAMTIQKCALDQYAKALSDIEHILH